MITPVFSVTQDEAFVYVCMRCPYIKVSFTAESQPRSFFRPICDSSMSKPSTVDWYVMENEFKCFATPYFLRFGISALHEPPSNFIQLKQYEYYQFITFSYHSNRACNNFRPLSSQGSCMICSKLKNRPPYTL